MHVPALGDALEGDVLTVGAGATIGWVTPEVELPTTVGASEGDVLTVDGQGAAGWAAVPDELPSKAGASAGDVLTIDIENNHVWQAPTQEFDALVVPEGGTGTISGTVSTSGAGVIAVEDGGTLTMNTGSTVELNGEMAVEGNITLSQPAVMTFEVGSTLNVDTGALAQADGAPLEGPKVLMADENGALVWGDLLDPVLSVGPGMEGEPGEYGVVPDGSAYLYTNGSAVAGQSLDLAGVAIGTVARVVVEAAQALTVKVESGHTIQVAGSTGITAAASAIGAALVLVKTAATKWVALSVVGSWTVTPE
jgi:hypothetical protein